MPRTLATTAVVALAFVCPASASVVRRDAPSAVATLGTPSRGARTTRVRLAGEGNVATLAFDVLSTSATAREVTLPLTLAPDAHVTGMTMTMGDRTLTAIQLAPRDARDAYERVMRGSRDPALLEHVATRDGRDTLNLRVFPVARTSPVHIELAIETTPPGTEWMTIDNVARFVTSDRSLVATEAPPPPLVIHCGLGVAQSNGDLDKAIIRRYVHRNLPRVKACYERALLGDNTLAGRVDLHFMIGQNGMLLESSVDGDLTTKSDAVRDCIAGDLATWQFPSTNGGSNVAVNYPLDFVASN